MEQWIQLIQAWQQGDNDSGEQLKASIYHHLKNITQQQRLKLNGNLNAGIEQLPQTTVLLHEALLNFFPPNTQLDTIYKLNNYLALFIRNFLIDEIRKISTKKRGGEILLTQLTGLNFHQEQLDEYFTFERAIVSLEQQHPHKSNLISLHYFLGLNKSQLAQQFNVSERTIYRELCAAKAYIKVHMQT